MLYTLPVSTKYCIPAAVSVSNPSVPGSPRTAVEAATTARLGRFPTTNSIRGRRT